jgi:hypothetical protein
VITAGGAGENPVITASLEPFTEWVIIEGSSSFFMLLVLLCLLPSLLRRSPVWLRAVESGPGSFVMTTPLFFWCGRRYWTWLPLPPPFVAKVMGGRAGVKGGGARGKVADVVVVVGGRRCGSCGPVSGLSFDRASLIRVCTLDAST